MAWAVEQFRFCREGKGGGEVTKKGVLKKIRIFRAIFENYCDPSVFESGYENFDAVGTIWNERICDIYIIYV